MMWQFFSSRLSRRFLLGVLAGSLLTILGSACVSSNTYPIDFFSEMHYQKSFRAQEPPRLDIPAGVVPITGGEPQYTFEEARNLQNPLANDPQAAARGQQLFQVNCVACHGPQGDGKGPLAVYWGLVQGAVPPANLKDPAVVARTDGELYWILTNGYTSPQHQTQYPGGLTNMPAFGKLLTPEQRWALVSYIRQLQQQP
uniref:Cytochrome c n=1 Tax=Thermomicrobium roseum TaxID=500 RepID=A0A7C2BF65_THERO